MERVQLRPYQQEAKRRALEHDGFCLFAEQRTGKTPIACEVVEERAPDLLLIACPKIAIGTWEDHLPLYDIKAQTTIITLDSVWANRKRLKRWLLKGKRCMTICDESHRIKDRNSKTSRAMRLLARLCDFRLALTGTPTDGKKVEQFWPQFDFIDPSVFGRWSAKTSRFGQIIGPPGFQNTFCVKGGFMGRKIIGYKNLKLFYKKLDSRYFRVELEDVKPVPTKIDTDNVVRFDLVESRKAYEEMEQKFILELEHAQEKIFVKVMDRQTGNYKYVKRRRVRVVAPLALTLGMKLHQLSGGFIFDDEGTAHRVGFEKLAHCGAVLEKLGKVPTIVFVRFLPELYMTAALCRQLGRTVTLISGKHAFRRFDTDVVVIQIRSAESIDLSRAEEVIFNSWDYSYIKYQQALFRNRSYTSVRARYHYLIANNTIDEVLFQCVMEKQNFARLVINKLRR